MADIFDSLKRSAVMSAIRGSGNKDTELRLIVLFHALGVTGWRRRQKIFGKPDFVFRREKIAVFVDGCFWHGCPKPKHAPLPKTRTEWWAAKLQRNKDRDKEVNRTLRQAGWRVLRIWECDLTKRNWSKTAPRLKRILAVFQKGSTLKMKPAKNLAVSATSESTASGSDITEGH